MFIRKQLEHTASQGCSSTIVDCTDLIGCPQVEAFEAYANREFSRVLQKLSDILAADPGNPRWYEMRGQVGSRLTQCWLHARAERQWHSL